MNAYECKSNQINCIIGTYFEFKILQASSEATMQYLHK